MMCMDILCLGYYNVPHVSRHSLLFELIYYYFAFRNNSTSPIPEARSHSNRLYLDCSTISCCCSDGRSSESNSQTCHSRGSSKIFSKLRKKKYLNHQRLCLPLQRARHRLLNGLQYASNIFRIEMMPSTFTLDWRATANLNMYWLLLVQKPMN